MINGKLIQYFRSHLYAIVSNMIHFLIPFGMRDKKACFKLCFTCTDAKLKDLNFHSSVALNNGKIVRYFKNHWYAIVSNMINVFILHVFSMREQMAIVELCVSPVLTQIKTFGTFMAY